MFIYDQRDPAPPTFAPSFDSIERAENSAAPLWEATRDLQIYRDNANAEDSAIAEAYSRRNRAIFDATGLQLKNPRRDFSDADLQEAARVGDAGGDPWAIMQRSEQDWLRQVQQLARERPEHAAVIAAGRAIQEDAFAITRGAEKRFAQANSDAADLGTPRRLLNVLGGGVSGMLRDPLQVFTLTAGGGIAGGARSVAGRIFSMMFTEAAVNAGVEGAVQAASQDYKRQAGVEHGLGDALQQVGIAALFGGGFGGLLQGGAEVLRLTGKAVPEEMLRRAAQGTPEPGDTRAIAEALGLQLDARTEAIAELAAEQRDLDSVAFGAPPAQISETTADAMAAQAVRAIENPVERVPDPQGRVSAIERIVQAQQPLGPAPQKPVTLFQFLSSKAIGGLRDDGGELAAMGLSRKFVPGGGSLVRKKGKTLDSAREAAAEAGYFDGLYGDPERAVAQSTVDDLLRLVRQEAGGEPVLSARNDGGREFEWLAFEQRKRAQDAYRHLVERIDSAAKDYGFDAIDDAIMVRAAELVDDQVDELDALERAFDEDYRRFADAVAERGDEGYDDTDIPFFDEDTGPGPRAGEPDGSARADGQPRERPADAPDGQPLPRAGGDARGETSQPLRVAGDTPEPGTTEAAELAQSTLDEVRGGTGRTAADAGEKPLDIAAPADFKADIQTGKRFEVFAAVRDYLTEKLAGKSVRNADDGSDIMFTAAGIRHFFRRGSKTPRPALSSALRIDDIAASARHVGTEPDAKGRRGIVAIHTYERAVALDGKTGVVRLIVREDTTGRRYYDHFAVRESAGPAAGELPPESSKSDQLLREPTPDSNIGDAEEAGKPADLWDAMPAGRSADGEVSHVTHAQLVEDADRDDFFGDLINSCKD